SSKAYLAAGMNKLLIAYPDTELLVRYDLGTFEKEVTVKFPLPGSIKQVCLGSTSAGPLLVCYSNGNNGGFGQVQVAFLDLTTFKELDAGPNVANGFNMVLGGGWGENYHFRARPDGRVFVGWNGPAMGVGHNGICHYDLSETGA